MSKNVLITDLLLEKIVLAYRDNSDVKILFLNEGQFEIVTLPSLEFDLFANGVEKFQLLEVEGPPPTKITIDLSNV